ncbi:vacuolar cation/proton exchanger 3-like isoform X3 [Cynara cardunculus var. scolymus]|uniref:vacuolar cation/proton exchanger 3-like isoform X3 n=1 Tax=Cynara cardunculus var. scolymus TaxID=59895 RepID=UPI000D62CC14|nr:vacuolar cation/proton exchanger 3-like isoform X3 [Cynara cardunculus var. scolymus]
MASSATQPWLLENGTVKRLTKDSRRHGHGRSVHNMSSSSLRKKSDMSLVSKVPFSILRNFLTNLQEVILGTKLSLLFIAIPIAIAAHHFQFSRPWIFSTSLIGLIPLAERVSFLTEQIAFYTGGTVGGLLNATCGNATELIIAIFALIQHKVDVVKYSLLGSILSNLLLVLGSSLLCGGLANLSREQTFDRKQADVNISLLLLALLCNVMPLLYKHATTIDDALITAKVTLNLSRACSIVMLLAYFAYLAFQLWTHSHIFEAQEEEDEDDLHESEVESPQIGFWSALIWLIGMTAIIALLSEYLVNTIEAASSSWGMPLSFISIILLPIVGNAAEHAGAVIFAFKNKLDITLGVALGSATQIAVFVVPVTVLVAWIIGINLDLDFNLVETGSFSLTILVTAFALQDGTSHYLKGVVLLLFYVVIGVVFFVTKSSFDHEDNALNTKVPSSNGQIFAS